MASSVFPVVTPPKVAKNSIILPLIDTVYEYVTDEFATDLYTFDSTQYITMEFYQGDTLESTRQDFLSATDITMPSGITRIRFWNTASTNAIVSWTLKSIFEDIDSTLFVGGTLDTITSTGTYTGTSTSGYAWVLAVGGGGGAGGAQQTGKNSHGGYAGSSGIGYIQLTGSVPVTIGTGGAGGTGGQSTPTNVPATNGAAGGTTSFGSLSVGGGKGSTGTNIPNDAASPGALNAVSGTYNGINMTPTYNNDSTTSMSTNQRWKWVKSGATGHGAQMNSDIRGGISGNFGLGGRGSGQYSGYPGYGQGENASGYGAGGGGAYNTGGGGSGTAGVVYVYKV